MNGCFGIKEPFPLSTNPLIIVIFSSNICIDNKKLKRLGQRPK